MLGIDTNVLVRFVVRDDESQYEKVRRLIRRQLQAGEPVFVSQLVMLETEWGPAARLHEYSIVRCQGAQATWIYCRLRPTPVLKRRGSTLASPAPRV